MKNSMLLIAATVAIASAASAIGQTSGAPRQSPHAAGDSSLDGQWRLVAAQSFAGYRIREHLAFLTAPSDAVGRTSVLSGVMLIDQGRISSVDVRGDPRTLKSDKSNRDDVVRHHVWGSCPRAAFTLRQPLSLPELATGAVLSLHASGALTLRCATHVVLFPLEARLVDGRIEMVGQLPLKLAEYGLNIPKYARLLSVSKTAKLEVQLVWMRQ